MDLITLDFETYYDKEFSLSKMTTESYIRDPQFEVIGVGIKVNNEPTEWASGTHEQIKTYLHTFNWEESMVLAGVLLFALGFIPILCASPVLFMGWKLVAVSSRLLKGTISELRVPKSSVLSESDEPISHQRN
jgi:flagellar biosynthesis component FlhA